MRVFMKLFYSILIFVFSLSFNCYSSEKSKLPIQTDKPDTTKIYPVAVIGAGAAGTMATLRSVLNHHEVLLFTGAEHERRTSRGNWVRTVDNIPGLSKYTRALLELRNETLLGLYEGPFQQGLYVIEDSIFALKKEDDHFILTDGAGNTYQVRYVILATGIMDEQPSIQGSIRPILKYANGQTAAYCLTCDGHRSLGKKTVVIGYDDDAASNAITLSEKYEHHDLVLLTNGNEPKISGALLEKLQKRNIRLETEAIINVLGDKEKKQLTGFTLSDGREIEASMAFVALGIRPNNQLAIQAGAALDARGLVLADAQGETNIPNLFVCGDLRANSMKQIYTAWQQAVESVQTINKRIRAKDDTP